MIPLHLLELLAFDTQAARRAGVTDFELRRAVNEGVLLRLKRRWYTGQRPAWPVDRHRLLVDVELRERQKMVASHYSAAALLGLPLHRVDWATVHLMRTSSGGSRSRKGVVIHRRVDDVRPSVALVIAQTALLCGTSGLMAADAALRNESVTRAEIAEAAKALTGRPGCGHLDPILRLADGRRESPLESRTALVYDGWELALEPQFEVPGTAYRADARIVGTRVLIESDGRGKYDGLKAVLREKHREDDVRALGWEVVRVTNDLLDRPSTLLARTRTALALAERRTMA